MIDSAAVKREFGSLDESKAPTTTVEECPVEKHEIELDMDNPEAYDSANSVNQVSDEDRQGYIPTTCGEQQPDSSRSSLTSSNTTTNDNSDSKTESTISGNNITAAAAAAATASNNNICREDIVTKVVYDEENFLDNESSSNDYHSEYDGYPYGSGERQTTRNDSSGEQKQLDHHQPHNHNRHNHDHHHQHNHNNHIQHHNHYNHSNSHDDKLNNDIQQTPTTMAHSEEPEQMRKLFIGGLDYKTSETTLKKHFERFGDVMDCVVMREPQSKRSRGFGFVIYANSFMVDKAQEARPHQIDGREVQSKRAISREDSGKPEAQATVKKVYLGGLSDDIERAELEDYFKMFGNIVNINIVAHKDTGKRRGFAFVEYDDYDPVDKIVLRKFHTIKDKRIEAKKAIPKIEMDARKRGVGDPRAAMAGTMMALAGGSPLESMAPPGGLRQRLGGRGGNGCGSAAGSYLWDRIPYCPTDYSANLDGYSHYHYGAAASWMMDGANGPTAGSYGPSRGSYGRSAYSNHLPNRAAATDFTGSGFPPSYGSGTGPMRLSYQHPRFGPYVFGYGGGNAGAHRGRGFNP